MRPEFSREHPAVHESDTLVVFRRCAHTGLGTEFHSSPRTESRTMLAAILSGLVPVIVPVAITALKVLFKLNIGTIPEYDDKWCAAIDAPVDLLFISASTTTSYMSSSKGSFFITLPYFLFILILSFYLVSKWREIRKRFLSGRSYVLTLFFSYSWSLASLLPLVLIPNL
jgi:hypothetical protein